MTILKALVAVLAAVLAAVLPGLTVGGEFGLVQILNVVVLAAAAIQVYNAANIPGWPIAKLIAAVVGAGLVVAISALSDNRVDPAEWVQIIIAVLGAAGVGVVPNVGARSAYPG
jgi:hypothetical protein